MLNIYLLYLGDVIRHLRGYLRDTYMKTMKYL